MKIQQSDFLDGEILVITNNANAIVPIDDRGLSRFALDQLMPVRGVDGIGGKLHLTNYRLLFKSHAFNRLVGQFSIFLPTILEVKDVSVLANRSIRVTTKSESFDFVVWGIPKLIAEIEAQRGSLDPAQIELVKQEVANRSKEIGLGLKKRKLIEGLKSVLLTLFGKSSTSLGPSGSEPSSLQNIKDFLSDVR